jgi:predicted MFS family arabinose efflux permease
LPSASLLNKSSLGFVKELGIIADERLQWLTFAPVSASAATYFDVSETAINWLSTSFLFAFVVSCPLVMWTLHRSPKESILWASGLLLLGNWIRYAGTRASGGVYGVVLFGQILTGLAQPFVLAAPTRYYASLISKLNPDVDCRKVLGYVVHGEGTSWCHGACEFGESFRWCCKVFLTVWSSERLTPDR